MALAGCCRLDVTSFPWQSVAPGQTLDVDGAVNRWLSAACQSILHPVNLEWTLGRVGSHGAALAAVGLQVLAAVAPLPVYGSYNTLVSPTFLCLVC